MTDLAWHDLPPKAHRWTPPTVTVQAELITDPGWLVLLRQQPGRWAVITTYPSRNTAGKQADLWRSRYGIETAIRRQADGSTAVYARQLGLPTDAEQAS